MTQWIALSRTAHAGQGYRPRQSYAHTAQRMLTPVLLAELSKLLPHYVLGFMPTENGPVPTALLGLEQGSNLYLHPDGRWLASYVPATLRSYPFSLSLRENGDQALSLKENHLTNDGDALFQASGELAPEVQHTLDFLAQCDANRIATLNAANALDQAGVLTPWALKVAIGERNRRVNGLQRINETALNALPPEILATLQGAPLQLAYAQLFSQAQGQQLSRLHTFKENIMQDSTTESMDELFSDTDDELRFNFDD